MQYIKSIAIAAVMYLLIMDFTWEMFRVVLPIWQAACFVAIIAVILYYLDSRDEKKQEDIELELGTRQVEIESRRLDAEDFILNSGDEEAEKFLKRARANPHSYVRILTEGMRKGNDTLRVALGILAGVFENNALPSIDDDILAKALDKMAAELAGTVFKEKEITGSSSPGRIRRHI